MSAPQCPSCEREAPACESVVTSMDEDEMGDFDLVAVTIHLRCSCGDEFGLKMRAKGEELS